ncbi:hypothetical protein Kpol_1051p9 [Vanderwaltozyma polyspora DSM 70294]|uniref:Uncharacterized protein n=1 Tax=Vanderwaltozyma polyspora (strain ATCC 22028 / DSM 70294 / BCRC 21397 / CBS 2163 / NBRC 10782 / NRRL Y-8283 / UCD 57-17) TaxID=436907 RepID=A7TMX3_VANPO|nr:uncharacterized protein Kpol_1051p9 [Vanderwaltozyma polyspora DSM 70294]EDO16361.1 hypothetical protein Kpol_1051p9 [Vanderwaltozyma polyspora DSM 70294]
MPSIEVDLCLFDLDGTIVSTTYAAEAVWRKFCSKYNVDPEELFKVSHGSRTSEMMARFFPNVDNTDNKAVKELEISIARNYLDLVTLIPGAKDLLLSLDINTTTKEKLPERKWAIVTSGSADLAFSWFSTILKEVGKPDVFITAFDVSRGKPDPEGYNKAQTDLTKILGMDPKSVRSVVFEDAPVGIKAGNAMGALTIGITSSYDKKVLFDAGADFVVSDLTEVVVAKNTKEGITIEIKNPLSKD